jgi:carbonic anhydrase
MGHSRCGAVIATVEALLGREPAGSRNLRSIVERLVPSVEPLLSETRQYDLLGEDTLIARAVRANVRASVDHLRHGSEILEEMVRKDGLMIVGAEYSLDSGIVTFLDDVQRRGKSRAAAVGAGDDIEDVG